MYECDCDLTEEEYPMKLSVSVHLQIWLDKKGEVAGVTVCGSNQGDVDPYPTYLQCSECGQEEDDYPDLPYAQMGTIMQIALCKMLGVIP